LASSVYESVGKPNGWAKFLDELARSYGGGKGTLTAYDAGVPHGFIIASGQMEPEQVTRYNDYYAAMNPWLLPVGQVSPRLTRARDPIGLVRPAEHVLPRTDLLKTEHYNDFLRPALRVDEAVFAILQKDDSRRVSLTVLFPQAERDFDTVGRLQRVVPHMLRAIQLNRQLEGLEARAIAAETVLDGLVTAMMVVNAAGHVVYMNAVAERIMAVADGPKVARLVLDAITPSEGRVLRQLVASALRVHRDVTASPGGVMRISRRSDRAPYEVLVSPISGTALGLGFDGPLAAVFLRDPEARIVTPTDRLRSLYQLTGAEARLMQALLAGETLDAIAERFKVSRETLRSQLKAVFLKTGTSSQVELLRLGLRGLAAFNQ
jgi:DNA-binding CsgD family transcriptional regulator/PAS domain-containing protein